MQPEGKQWGNGRQIDTEGMKAWTIEGFISKQAGTNTLYEQGSL